MNTKAKDWLSRKEAAIHLTALGYPISPKTLANLVPNKKAAHDFMVNWCAEVRVYKIGPFIEFTQTLMAHWYGILNFFESRLTNGLLEGINHKIQLAKRRARGYRNTSNYINMIYFLCGKLEFDYPHKYI